MRQTIYMRDRSIQNMLLNFGIKVNAINQHCFQAGVYDPKRLFGVSTLDVVRARAFIGEALGVDPQKVNIPVIGGHSGVTILPVLSQCQPAFKGDQSTIEKLTVRIQEAGTEVVKAIYQIRLIL